MKYKIKAAEMVSSYIGRDTKTIYELIEESKKMETGNFVLPCFKLKKFINKNPDFIAKELCENIFGDEFEKIENVGPYLNFFINRSLFAYEIINKILKDEYIAHNEKRVYSKNIGIEFAVPKNKSCFKIYNLLAIIKAKSLARLYESHNNNVVLTGYVESKPNTIEYDEKFIEDIGILLKYQLDEIYYKEVYYKESVDKYGLQDYIFDDSFMKFISLEKYNMAPYIIWTSDYGNTEKFDRLNFFVKFNSKYEIDKYIHIGGLFDKYEYKQLFKIIEVINQNKGRYKDIEFVHNNILNGNRVDVQYTDLLMKVLDHMEDGEYAYEDISEIIFDLFIHILEQEKKLNYNNQDKSLNYIKTTIYKINNIINDYEDKEVDWSLLTTEVRLDILKKLDEFKKIVDKSIEEICPEYIAGYILEIAVNINDEFINKSNTFLNKSEKEFLKAALKIIDKGLYLLGISDK